MNQRITRRRFGQMTLASAAVTGLGYIASKSSAQTLSLILGVSPSFINNTTSSAVSNLNGRGTHVLGDTAAAEPLVGNSTTSTNAVTTVSLGITVNTLDLGTGTSQVRSQVPANALANNNTPTLQTNESLTGFTTLANGTLVVAITPVFGSPNASNSSRLVTLGSSTTSVKVSGLSKQEKLGSLVGTNDGGLFGLVMLKNGAPPFRVVKINLQTGHTTDAGFQLPTNQSFTTLAQCPDHTLYTVSVAGDGTNTLVKLDLAQRNLLSGAKLQLAGGILNNGLAGLICSSAGQLIAFGAPRYQTPNNLYNVDPTTGATSLLKPFNAVRVALNRR